MASSESRQENSVAFAIAEIIDNAIAAVAESEDKVQMRTFIHRQLMTHAYACS